MAIDLNEASEIADCIAQVRKLPDLRDHINEIVQRIGFTYYAITEHINVRDIEGHAIDIVNYPNEWQRTFRSNRLFGVDPVHRASCVRTLAFAWNELSRIIPLTSRDRFILETSHHAGLVDGVTIPINIPGHVNGSCSFALTGDARVERLWLPTLQFVGQVVYEAAYRLHYRSSALSPSKPRLTDRQRDCVALLAQGLTTREIARKLGISYETAVQHIKDASASFGVKRRANLVIRALLEGSISFRDVAPRFSPFLGIK